MHNGMLKVSVGQKSDPGPKPENEDSMGIATPSGLTLANKGVVAVIADGVSSADAGKEASAACVKNFIADYLSTPDTWSVKTSAHRVLSALNRWLYGQSLRSISSRFENNDHKGYISTMSVLILKSTTASIFHIGDSRIYRFRSGDLELLTRDHSVAVGQGKAYLARAMGMDLGLDVDYKTEPLQSGDVFLLTTDGVHDFLPRRELSQYLETLQDPDSDEDAESTANRIVADALARGSDDNTTCQVIQVTELPDGDADEYCHKLNTLPFPPFLSEGMIFDGYRILKELHASSRSQVYLVEDTESHQHWVMKTPSVNFVDDPAYIERFVLEEWIGKRVNSPHVVRVIEPERDKKWLYYLTEYVAGASLERWIGQNRSSGVEQIVRIAEQIVQGLRAFHRKDTLHQDIKPANIMVNRDGTVKIIDFGSCKVAGIDEIQVPIERDQVLGTATYSAPEYRLRRSTGVQSDLFSVSVVAYEMLTGYHPYGQAYEECQDIRDFSQLKYAPAWQYNPMVPDWIDGALRKGCSISRESRYDSLSEFIFDLKHPNKSFLKSSKRPLIERNPLVFWKSLTLILLVTQVLTIGFLMQ
ncbi:MAG: bifunctional protein-serine/threonine kinase/phosphatase [Pseudomonadales bacterium]|nr:bifunctional protein-serine/threonine kinase/phosphatase [Pseudomonadales bacterium]